MPERYTDEMRAYENAMQKRLETAWQCQMYRLAEYDHCDWRAERDGQTVAWVEYKKRSSSSTAFDTVYLNKTKKYDYLMSLSYSHPALFVIEWADGVVKWIDIRQVDASATVIAGDLRYGGSRGGDLEPMILLPISEMNHL